jgi:hypothetical protein
MQGIYTYIPETNNVPREYIVAAILVLLLLLLLLLLAYSLFSASTCWENCTYPRFSVGLSSVRGRKFILSPRVKGHILEFACYMTRL